MAVSRCVNGLRALADALLAVGLAAPCVVCRRPLERPTEGPACAACWTDIRPLLAPFCAVCGDPLMSWRSGGPEERCPGCQTRRYITRGRAIGEYEGALRAILHALKYENRRSLSVPLGRLMVAHGAAVLAGADAAVPVPLHWRRQWLRGFNQAADLASQLGLPVCHALKRRRATSSQTGLSAAERRRNVRQAFALRRRASVHGLCVVVVDDVSTTGATLDACARVLVEGGVQEVRTLTAARVVTKRPRPPQH